MSDKTPSEETTITEAAAPLDPPTPPAQSQEDFLAKMKADREKAKAEAELRDAMVDMAVRQVDSAVLHLTKAIPAIMAAKQFTKAGLAGRTLANLIDLSHDLHCVIGFDFNPEADDDDDAEEVWF